MATRRANIPTAVKIVIAGLTASVLLLIFAISVSPEKWKQYAEERAKREAERAKGAEDWRKFDESLKQKYAPKPAPPYKIAADYIMGRHRWRAVVVKSGVSDEELKALAVALHKEFPVGRFHIFDDASQVKAYTQWTVHYKDERYPFPELWALNHHLGMINLMLADRTGHLEAGLRWQLTAGDARGSLFLDLGE